MSDARPGDAPRHASEDAGLRELLERTPTIAVVGLSDKPDRPSHRVARYLLEQGYVVVPVNPRIERTLGLQAYPDLLSVPHAVDLVDIFRRPEAVPEIVRQAIAVGAAGVWMQEGVVHEEAAKTAREAGLRVVMDRCIYRTHARLFGSRRA